jgi:cell division septation protein DedD
VAPLAASDQGSYQVQVNALADRPAADHLVRELDGKGYKAVISPAKVGARTLYRVRVGRFATEESARKAVAHLREIGYPRSFVAAEPQ